MARVLIPIVDLVDQQDGIPHGNGVGDVYLDPALDARYPNDGRILLWAKNTDANPQEFHILTGQTVEGTTPLVGTSLEWLVVIPASSEVILGPFPPGLYNREEDPRHAWVDSANSFIRVKGYRLPVLTGLRG